MVKRKPWLQLCLPPNVVLGKGYQQSSTNQSSKSITEVRAVAGNGAPAFIIELITVVRDAVWCLTLAMVVPVALLLKVFFCIDPCHRISLKKEALCHCYFFSCTVKWDLEVTENGMQMIPISVLLCNFSAITKVVNVPGMSWSHFDLVRNLGSQFPSSVGQER